MLLDNYCRGRFLVDVPATLASMRWWPGSGPAWVFFGGVFAVVFLDNMKAIVEQAGATDPRLNDAVRDYAQSRGSWRGATRLVVGLFGRRSFVSRHRSVFVRSRLRAGGGSCGERVKRCGFCECGGCATRRVACVRSGCERCAVRVLWADVDR